jgi:hypothetical protein
MATRKKMICHSCGQEMNFHAEKLDYAAALLNPEAADPDSGAILEEAHSCPGCGLTELIRPESK